MKSGIYMWTSPSGKSYIGQSVDLIDRYREFIRFDQDYAGDKINKARRKYNKISDWSYQVIEYCSIDELDDREKYYIDLYNTIENGYNLASGGNKYKIFSNETIQKLSEMRKGENNPFFGKHHSDETKKKMSESRKGENHPMWGKHHSNETKQKLSKANRGYHHTEEAKQKIGLRSKGERNPNFGKLGKDSPCAKKVLQYTKDGVFVCEWHCIKDVETTLGIPASNITACCKNKIKSAGGYIWKYKEESD